jgi:transposase
MTIQIEFSADEIEKLNYERYNYPHPKVQKKMEALYLKSQNLPHNQICSLCHISESALTSYLHQYIKEGIEGLKKLGYKGKPNELMKHAQSLEQYFKENPPRNINEARDTIERLTGIKRSPTQIREFLKKIGMRCLKVGFVPGKAANPEKINEQEQFKKDELEPRLAEAKEGKRSVFFVDAAHFVHGSFLGFLWCFARIFIPSPSGRKRFNVLAALDAVSKEITIVTNETYINAESVCQLMAEIAKQGLDKPITFVLDNARYQKCALVQNYAAALNIELLYLPSYSPHLNLIERFWKFVRKDCLYSKYYEKFPEFKQAIDNCIRNAHAEHKDELETLLSWNFQSFKNVKISAV